MPSRRFPGGPTFAQAYPAPLACLAVAGALVAFAAAPAHALPLEITTSSLAAGTAGVAYSDAIVAANGTPPYTWTLDGGSLPAGITLDGATGGLSGTATLAGTSDFLVLVTDAAGDTATRALSLGIAPAAAAALSFQQQPTDVAVGAVMSPAVQVKVTDAFGNAVAGEPVSLALAGTGTLSGGGPVASDASGIATFAALSVDRAGPAHLEASAGALGPVASDPFTVSCAAITLSPATLPDAPLGAAWSQPLSASGGTAPYAFAVTAGALPSGISLSGAGLLSGTATTAGSANFTVTATDALGCPGATAYVLTVPAVPAAAGDLVATRLASGNDADGTARIQLTFTPTAFTTSAEVYRAPFGGYPRYDDAGGLEPPTPGYPPGPPWTLTTVSASGQSDEPATRDCWAYVVFLKNEFGQVSAVSNKTACTTDYALGDVSDGAVAGSGDNQVNLADVSLLGAWYGLEGAALLDAGVSYLDVGPTLDLSVTSRPFTDGRLDFEDLIVFATEFGAVSSPAAVIANAQAARRSARAAERLEVSAPSRVEPGATFTAVVSMRGEGRVQGLSAELAWDPAVAEPVSVTGSAWIEAQDGVVLSPRPGTLDVALLGARATGLAGAGDLATVTFRSRGAGDPAVRIARVLARDAANRPLGADVLAIGPSPDVPSRTLLLAPAPNPASGPAALSFALAQAGELDLAIYSVDGRRVRVIAHGTFAPGSYRFTWAGDDDQRRRVAPGLYFAQLSTRGKRWSRALVRIP